MWTEGVGMETEKKLEVCRIDMHDIIKFEESVDGEQNPVEIWLKLIAY